MSAYTRAGKRLAEESQLLSEERWIIEAIKKIRTQRNCLQIERLQLESMLASQKLGPQSKVHSVETEKIVAENLNPEPNLTTLLQNMQCTLDMTTNETRPERVEADMCNGETLNLSVTHSINNYGILQNVQFVEDDEEEEEDNEGDENEEVDIDMNMFMNL